MPFAELIAGNEDRIVIKDNRFYVMPDGELYPSVTSILKYWPKTDQFMKWIGDKGNDEANRIKNEAGERGTIVHNGIELLLKNNELNFANYSLEEWKFLIAFRNFALDYKLEPVDIEKTVWSKKHKLAGTLDCAGYLTVPKVGRIFTRLDWKTSKNFHDEYGMQSASYDVAVS